MIIESNDNSKLKLIRKLSRKKTRHKEGLYIVEGINLVNHAMGLGADIEFILFSTRVFEVNGGREIVKRIYSEGVDYAQVDDRIFEKTSDMATSQGILGVVKIRSLSDQSELSALGKKCIYVDQIQDPGNLGTIIRTADAAGFNDIFISKGTVDPYNPKTIRATMGSILNLNIYLIDDSTKFLGKLKEDEYQIVTTEMDASNDYNNASYSKKVVLVVGNEGSGISDEVLNLKNLSVKIPITGSAESLNAGIAAGIMMYKIKEIIES